MATNREPDSTSSSEVIQASARNNIVEEYITQFLGFTPKSFCDGVYNAIYDYIYDAVNAMNQDILQMEIPHVREEDINIGGQTIVNEFLNKSQKAFDKLEIYVRQNIFVIPDAVLLPEDQEHAWNSYSLEDERRLDQDILEIQQKIKNMKYMQAMLQKEDEELELIVAEYTKLINQLNDAGISSKSEGLAEVIGDRLSIAKSVMDFVETIQTKD